MDSFLGGLPAVAKSCKQDTDAARSVSPRKGPVARISVIKPSLIGGISGGMVSLRANAARMTETLMGASL